MCVSLHPLSRYLEPSLGPYVTPPRGAETSSDLHWRHNRSCGRAGGALPAPQQARARSYWPLVPSKPRCGRHGARGHSRRHKCPGPAAGGGPQRRSYGELLALRAAGVCAIDAMACVVSEKEASVCTTVEVRMRVNELHDRIGRSSSTRRRLGLEALKHAPSVWVPERCRPPRFDRLSFTKRQRLQTRYLVTWAWLTHS